MAGITNFKAKVQVGSNTNQRCGEVPIYDTTGVFNGTTNMTGWGDGSNNPQISQVDTATAKLVFSDGSYWPKAGGSGNIYSAVNPGFPNVQGVPFVVTEAMLEQRPPDGVVTAEVEYSGSYDDNGTEVIGVLAKATATGFLTCNAQCCVAELQDKAMETDDLCESPEWDLYFKARKMLEGIWHDVECKKFDRATVTLKALQQLCANGGANCGC